MDALEIDGPPSKGEQGATAGRQKLRSNQRATVENFSDPPTPVNRNAEIGKREVSTELAFQPAKKLQQRGDLSGAERLFNVVLAMRPDPFGSRLPCGSVSALTDRL